MKHLLLATCLALGVASYPALAEEAAQKDESIHAPTNRIDKLVPTMKAPGAEEKSQGSTTFNAGEAAGDGGASGSSGAASGEPKSETVLPPTNRVGKAVPDMKSPDATDDLPSEQPAK